MPLTTAPAPDLTARALGEPGSPAAFAAAFDFIQMNSNGRYTDTTLMSIRRLSARAEDLLISGTEVPWPRPTVATISTTVTYDEDTEVKRGGVLATAVAIPGDIGTKFVLAVKPEARLEGHGRSLVQYMNGAHVNPYTWVGNGNLDGQRFLLNLGMFPVRMNRRNAVMYAYHEPSDEDGVAL